MENVVAGSNLDAILIIFPLFFSFPRAEYSPLDIMRFYIHKEQMQIEAIALN